MVRIDEERFPSSCDENELRKSKSFRRESSMRIQSVLFTP